MLAECSQGGLGGISTSGMITDVHTSLEGVLHMFEASLFLSHAAADSCTVSSVPAKNSLSSFERPCSFIALAFGVVLSWRMQAQCRGRCSTV